MRGVLASVIILSLATSCRTLPGQLQTSTPVVYVRNITNPPNKLVGRIETPFIRETRLDGKWNIVAKDTQIIAVARPGGTRQKFDRTITTFDPGLTAVLVCPQDRLTRKVHIDDEITLGGAQYGVFDIRPYAKVVILVRRSDHTELVVRKSR